MVFIVYDLEMTVRRKKSQIAEIIEIGAVKLVEADGKAEIAGTFQALVRPSKLTGIKENTTVFTGITEEELAQADRFPDVLRQFIEWIGHEDYYLCAWGPDDKLQFVRDCRAHQLDMDWIRNHNNLQKQMSRILKREKHQQVGLKAALELLEIPFEGAHHRALDDALNTAKIFQRLYDQFVLERNTVAEDSVYTEEIVYKTATEGDEPDSPFAKLAGLFPSK
ncbi:or 3'-5' exonuclease KapD [Paenibacillus sp. J31TS4]|uniref:3'-5' exonuclease n=1 Tax=Paenibacillus sp. J31TS4 TaxID=2807195 RepID=UPI001B219701|nr:3'-5' exonuclease [Paenibacillus sp. J31TS4]GIP39504.1 or 3'-5' exonuclease KapD [Paenibacillus sp. J31TS4]